jgi:DNA-binding transcriptional LysR family regulator
MSYRTNLDIDVLRTFVTGVELGSFARAADQLGRSPSALSAQLRKLEEQAGQELFRKAGRGLALTYSGEVLLSYARRMLELNDETVAALRASELEGWLRLGLPQGFAENGLPAALGRFSRAHPKVRIEARVERNADLLERLAAGQLDIAVAWSDPQGPGDGKHLFDLPMVWIGVDGALPVDPDEGLPLVVFEPPCVFRSAALRALDEAGRRWRLTFTSPSLSGLWAAASAGLGVTVRTPVGLPPTLKVLDARDGLPPLPRTSLTLHTSKEAATPARTLLAQILEETLLDAVSGSTLDATADALA